MLKPVMRREHKAFRDDEVSHEARAIPRFFAPSRRRRGRNDSAPAAASHDFAENDETPEISRDINVALARLTRSDASK